MSVAEYAGDRLWVEPYIRADGSCIAGHWREIPAGSSPAMALSDNDAARYRDALGQRGVKGRIWIDPHMRAGRRVTGYWQDRRLIDEVMADLREQFTKALATRNKWGRVMRSRNYEYWKPPQGWFDMSPMGDGAVKFAQEFEYEDGKRGIVYVFGRHTGKAGKWDVKTRYTPFEKFSPELIDIRDRFAAVDPILEYDKYEEETGKIAKDLGWIEISGTFLPKYGDYGISVKHHGGQGAALVVPKTLDDYERRRRFQKLIDQEKQEALVVGRTTKAEVEAGLYLSDWKIEDRGDNTFDLIYRREGRQADDLELRGYRVQFDANDVLTEVGLPSENTQGMASEDEYKAMVHAERERVKKEENDRNERVVAITKRLREALNGMPDLPPPEKASEMKPNLQTPLKNFEVGDRFAVKTKVYEVTGKIETPKDLPVTQYKADEWEPITKGYSQSIAEISAFEPGDFVRDTLSEDVYKVLADPNPEGGYPEWKSYRIQDVRTGQISDPNYRTFQLMEYKLEGVTAAAVSGRGQGVDRTFPTSLSPEKAWRKKLADKRVGGEAPSAQLARGAALGIDGADWDEVREALRRMNFEQTKRYNRKIEGEMSNASYTEVWARGSTGSEVKFTVTKDPDKSKYPTEGPSVPQRLWDHGRPYVSTPYLVDAGSVKITRGTREADRKRIKGRVPADKEEWRSDMLGRADELADHYGETSEATVVVFATGENAPPDMNAYIDGRGVIVLGVDVQPALQEYSDAVASGTVTDEIRGRAWRAWATAQHEVIHSVNRAGGWWGGYSDADGTKNFEETLTEELARVMVNEWARSASAPDVADWSSDNAASMDVQGAYQTFRANFKGLLDEMEIPESERMDLLERWKFNTNWQKRMQEFSEMLSDHLDIPVDAAKKRLKEILAAKKLNNGYTEGVMRVQEFRPILKVGPLPPRRTDAEIEQLRTLVEPLRSEWLRLREEWRAGGGGPRNYLTPEGAALKEKMLKAREAYFDKMEGYDLAPLYEDYAG